MKRLLLLLCLIPAFISCGSDDDEAIVIGTWKMVYTKGYESVNGNVIDSWDGAITYDYLLFLNEGGVGSDYNSKRNFDKTRYFEWFLHDGEITMYGSDGYDSTYVIQELTTNTLVFYSYRSSGNTIVETTQTYKRVKE